MRVKVGRKVDGVGVMRDKELKFLRSREIEVSHTVTLGGSREGYDCHNDHGRGSFISEE